MVMICILVLVTVVTCHAVHESAEETYNITTLYPVTNGTIRKLDYEKHQQEHTESDSGNSKTNLNKNDKENSEENQKTEVTVPRKLNITKWKIDATYVHPKDIEITDSNSTESKETLTLAKPTSKTVEKEFKPSPHLGSFFDDGDLNLQKFVRPKPYSPIEKKPTLDFTSSKDLYTLNYRSPEHTYRDQIDAPYRFDNSYFPQTASWKLTLDSKPTVESPTRVPAGGLYKHSNPFKEKPSSNGNDDDFGLAFTEDGKEKENQVKKRSNPWKRLLSLVTAFIPVGLIISALTPSVVTIHGTDDDPQSRDKAAYGRKHCYKIYCKDPQALSRVLHWLLAHRPARLPPPLPARPEPAHHGQYKEDHHNTNLMHHHRSYDFT